MKYINTFKTHASYEEKLNGGGVDISLPNVSYCEDVKDVNYNPYNTVEFYVGEITGTTPQTVKIYTDLNTSVDITVSEGNKWYTYVLPKDEGLCMIEGDSVKKVVVKSNISYEPRNQYPTFGKIIPRSTIEVSFKGSDTSNVTNMRFMFYYCDSLTSLDVSNFNTSNVTDMGSMFIGCSGLTSLDLSGWDTSNVRNMGSMFNDCNGLKSLDLRNFNTSNVTRMNDMFKWCTSLTSLDLSNFNTSNVTDMSFMFSYCRGLTSLVLSHFNTSNVTDMSRMFMGCSGLTSLDLSNFNTSNVTDMSWMFDGCSKLKTIRMVGCSTDTVNKIKAQLTKDNITRFTIVTE